MFLVLIVCFITLYVPATLGQSAFDTECKRVLNSVLTVESNSFAYNSRGRYVCSIGYPFAFGQLTMYTICQSTSTWLDEESVECWSAPAVNITSLTANFLVREKQNLILNCQYDDAIPVGNSSVFNVGGTSYIKTKGEHLNLTSLQSSDNNKEISCQAVTPFTQLAPFNDTGISEVHQIGVHYIPKSVSNYIYPLPHFEIGTDGTYFMTSSGTVALGCVNDANPAPTCIWSICGETCQDVEADTHVCETTYEVINSTVLFCVATNAMGSKASARSKIEIVPKSRKLRLYVPGYFSRIKDRAILRLGSSVTLYCKIELQYKIRTTFVITVPTSVQFFGSELVAKSLTRSSTGKYHCLSNDSFGSYETSFYIDVVYEPYQETKTLCSWILKLEGKCKIPFYSNPPASFLSLTRNGKVLSNRGLNQLYKENDAQVFEINTTKVSFNHNGTYKLLLRSTMYPYNHTIEFVVKVVGGSTAFARSPGSTVAEVSVLFVVLDAVAVGLIALALKKQFSSKPTGQPRSRRVASQDRGRRRKRTISKVVNETT